MPQNYHVGNFQIHFLKLISYILFLTMTQTTFANDKVSPQKPANDQFAKETSEKIKQYKSNPSIDKKNRQVIFKNKNVSVNANTDAVLTCGIIIDKNTTMTEDLDCPDYRGFAVQILGDNITLNGKGHKINAPKATAGIFMNGKHNTVLNTKVNGLTEGFGILAYNSPEAGILLNDFSDNWVGIVFFADNTTANNVQIINNKVLRSTAFAIRVQQDAPGVIDAPQIEKNDLRSSRDFAVYLKVQSFELQDQNNNMIAESGNGFYLKEGNFNIHDLSLANQSIKKRSLFFDNASAVVINNVNVTTRAPATEDRERVGIALYQSPNFQINQVTAQGLDAGIYLSTEQGKSMKGKIENSIFSQNAYADINLVSWDDTVWGDLTLSKNQFDDANGKVIVEPGTIANISK